MPEGPEVAKMAKEVRDFYKGKTCLRIEVKSGKYSRYGLPNGMEEFNKTAPHQLKEVNVHGKFVWFSWGDWDTWVQFGMTGYFCSQDFEEASIPHIRDPIKARKCEKHGHIWFYFRDAKPLIFVDQRNFGLIQFVNHKETLGYLNELGPDPLQQDLEKKWWESQMKRRLPKTQLGSLLLDQSFVAGIGNYLRSEILWKARLHPERTLESLTKNEKLELWNALQEVPREKAEEENETGDLTFWVYRRKEDVKGNPVIPLRFKSRTIWIAHKRQK